MTKEAMEAHKDSKMWEIAGGDIEKVDGKTAFDGMRADDEVEVFEIEVDADEL